MLHRSQLCTAYSHSLLKHFIRIHQKSHFQVHLQVPSFIASLCPQQRSIDSVLHCATQSVGCRTRTKSSDSSCFSSTETATSLNVTATCPTGRAIEIYARKPTIVYSTIKTQMYQSIRHEGAVPDFQTMPSVVALASIYCSSHRWVIFSAPCNCAANSLVPVQNIPSLSDTNSKHL